MLLQQQFDYIFELITNAQHKEQIMLYWTIGQFVQGKLATAEWSEGTVTKLSTYLQGKDPKLNNFNKRDIHQMQQFYMAYADFEMVSAMPTLLSWTNHLEMLSQTKISEKRWQIAIDTGGTFTDCIAIAPSGKIKKIKVLSTGQLRATLTKRIAPYLFEVQHKLGNLPPALLKDYTVKILTSHIAAKIISINKNKIVLNIDFQIDNPSDIEITGFEEAPILAARLVTQTPLSENLPPITLKLGSTKGTNALLEKKGANVVFITTKGFKDVVEIGTQQRPHLFQLAIPQPDLLYKNVIEVPERLAADGTILQPLSQENIAAVVAQVKKSEAEAVAIALMHSYKNDVHEQLLGNALSEAGIRFISLSKVLSPVIQLVPRANTALVNAYLSPIIHAYIQNILQKLAPQSHFKVMTSAGGLTDATQFQPKDSLLSGPAGGMVGAAKVAQSLGFQRILTLDMGGTSADAARFDGQFDYSFSTKIGNATLLSPTLAIETVAAGGGSICGFDGFKLTVGPESAGASPGPACYGAGGPLTITDVNLLLGKLDASRFSFSVKVADATAKLQAMQREIAAKTSKNYSKNELLMGWEAIVNEKMANVIRTISIAKGFDPKQYALMAFGGAGGLHATQVADLLGIRKVILPYDAGILSAFGIGEAQVAAIAMQQILQSADVLHTNFKETLEKTTQNALKNIEKEGFAPSETFIQQRMLAMRYRGQDSVLEVIFEEKSSLESICNQFRKEYQLLFGYAPAGRNIEIESLKVIAATKNKTKRSKKNNHIKPSIAQPISTNFNETTVYDWEKLPIGATFSGKSVLINAHATAYISEGWAAEVANGKNIILQKNTNTTNATTHGEAIELELFTNRFAAIANEMGAQLQRTAFSVNIKERLDFSCALLDNHAELVVNAPHIPVHLGSLGICARLCLAKLPVTKNDVLIVNHPKYGGSHLPDVTLLKGVFDETDNLIGYVINRAHHAEIGGKRPGSMPPDATILTEEGVVIAPTYLIQNNDFQLKTLEHLFLIDAQYPTRNFEENLTDIRAALASLYAGEAKLQQLVRENGLQKVHYYMKALKKYTAEALQHALLPYQNQQFRAEEMLDDGHKIVASIKINPSKITFDFTGTSPVHPYNLNANISIVYSVILYVLRILCKKEIPLNEGLMQNVDIILEKNTFLHPDFSETAEKCPAVVGGNTEVSQRLTDTLLKALGLAACSQGTMNNFLFGNEKFGYYETIGGGTGATATENGRSAIHQHMTNTKITDPEILEWRYPVRLREFSIRPDSGGKGRFNGGNGMIRAIEFLEKMEVTLLTQHRKVPPYGMLGGENGKCGQQILQKTNGDVVFLEGCDSISVANGDVVTIETPGGGAWGYTIIPNYG
jgi:5-oxoprolinase (ATP-hydrolysing)